MNQLALFNTELFTNYDESIEPPDPDEYPTVEGYESAYAAWARKYPHLVRELQGMSEDCAVQEQYTTVLEWMGFTGQLSINNGLAQLTITRDHKLCLTVENSSITQHEAVDWFHQEVEDLISHGVAAQVKNAPEQSQKLEPVDTDGALQPYNCVREQVARDTCDTVREQKPIKFAPEQSQKLEPVDTDGALQPYNCVREQVARDTCDTVREQEPVKFAPEKTTHWVEEYWVKRDGQKYKYYRYCWMEGRKIRRCHIGGSVRSPIARRKKAAVESAIAFGLSPGEIEKIIKSRE